MRDHRGHDYPDAVARAAMARPHMGTRDPMPVDVSVVRRCIECDEIIVGEHVSDGILMRHPRCCRIPLRPESSGA